MAAARCPRAVGGADAEDPREPSSATPPPARWGHCALPHEAWLHSRVQVVDGLDGVASREPAARRREGGRGLFVSGGAGDAPVAAGTLLAEEAPVILATDYAALERYLLAVCGGAPGARLPADSSVAVLSGESEATLRHAILSLYAGPGAQAATARQRVRGVLSHNMHSADPLPCDGRPPELGGPVGLWPTGSLINHSFLRPNVARSFEQSSKKLQLRAIRELLPGEELLDNYLDSCSTHAQRSRAMRDQHGLTERRDALDWSAGLLDEALEAAESAQAMLRGWRPGHASSTSALHSLLAVRDKLLFPGSGAGDGRGASSPQDPALALFFGALAEAASAAGLPELATSSWERVLELATKREPFSYRGAMAAVRLAIVAQRAAAEASAPPGSTQGGTPAAVMPPAPELLAAAERRLQAAREHWRVVFGASAGGCGGDAFEARNPSLFPGSAARAAFQQGLPWWGSGTCVNDGPRQGPGDAAQCASAGGLAGPPSVEPSSVERSGLLPESDAAWDIFG